MTGIIGFIFKILLVIFCIVFWVVLLWLIKNDHTDENIENAYEGRYKDGTLDVIETVYKGGFSDVSIKNETCDVLFFEDKIKFLFRKNQAFRDVKEIYNKDIVSVEFATESYIQNQMSIGGLLVFGWVGAIALGGSSRQVKEYVMIRFVDEDNRERAVILNAIDKKELLNRLKQQRKNKAAAE